MFQTRIFFCVVIIVFAFQFTFAQSTLSLDDIWLNSKYAAKGVGGFNAMNDGEHYTEVVTNGDTKEKFIVVKSFKTGETTDTILQSHLLLPPDSVHAISFDSYWFSNDESKILLSTQTEKIYRRSFAANYFVFDIKTKTTRPVSKNGKQISASFSPDGNNVAFVRNNNIYISNIFTSTETAVTTNGKKNEIINGICDWVYEEEFAFVQAFQWSPDGKYIAYMQFDESKVPEYTIQYFRDLYPENYTYKYPKVGEPNSVVSLFAYNVFSKQTATILCGSDLDYFPRLQWTNVASQLCITRLNRLQNRLDLLLANMDSTTANITTGRNHTPFLITANIFFTETNDRYIEINNYLKFFDGNKHFMWVSSKNGFNHIYIYNADGNLSNQVTTGNFDITNVYGLDEKTNTIYFQSDEGSPLERNVFSIKTNGTGKKQLTAKPGVNNADFSKGFLYFLNNHSDANNPPDFSLMNSDGKLIRPLEDNSTLKKNLDALQLSKKTFFTFQITDGTTLNGYLILPSHFDSTQKYPVFMTCYGGPGSQQVLNSWGGNDFMYQQYLSQHGYIIACVDNRGTGGRGENFTKMTYLQLGNFETQDQISAAHFLQTKQFVDPTRIGMFGWSFGGYMACRCISIGSDVFKTAIAVAPVTDWRFYDSIYTERYMRTDSDNKAGYDSTSVISYANKIKGNFLLVHGLSDDNVHYQNSAMLMKTLYQNNIPFTQYTFPDKNHSINGGNTRYYLFTQISQYIFNNL